MNPSFMAMNKAVASMMTMMLTGKEHTPKKDKETSINGRAFAPGKGVQQLESSEEKEANVQKHLDKLAAECKARYLDRCFAYPTIYEMSSKVDENSTKEETLNALHAAHAKYMDKRLDEPKVEEAEELSVNALGMTRGELSDAVEGARDAHIAKIKCPTIAEVAAERHKSHQDYIDRQIEQNRALRPMVVKAEVEPVEPKYPTSDLIDALHEHIAEQEEEAAQARRVMASKACIYTGEHMNLEEAGANNGTKFEAQ